MGFIAVLDYDIGNLRSVQKAFQHVAREAFPQADLEIRFARTAPEFEKADALVLPGVGAFGDCLRALRRSGMELAVMDWARADRPFFGICVGFQMLFSGSEEAPGVAGLGLFEGQVKKFSGGPGLKIPQIGWNTVTVQQPKAPLLAGVQTGDYVYFVHSYYVAPKDPALVALETIYGEPFAAAIQQRNLIATQFHPEKSQSAGLRLIENFIGLSQALLSD